VWANARLAVPGVLIFSVITLVVTLLHLDAFHLGPGSPVTARLAAWGWLVVYVAFPVVMACVLIRQVRAAGVDPARRHALPGWFRVVLGVQAALTLAAGVALLLLPSLAGPLWPWPLTTLTAQAVGAWCVGLGAGGLHAVREDDWSRVRGAVGFYLGFGALGLIAMARYPAAVAWGRPSAWIVVAWLATMVGGGVYAAAGARRLESG
jgi:hypothetical protein